ncbi:hypothetical protein EK21DRAFT_20385, partial [Setomelanomma holmii]
KFKCLQQGCGHKLFSRQAELRRHYDTIHSYRKPEFWCIATRCPRARVNRRLPFPRKGKLRDHVRKKH